MKNKQTAVEWIESWIVNIDVKLYSKEFILGILKEAKAMEKEQHGETWDKALDAYEGRGYLYVRAWEDFDHYYNETYGN